MANSKNTPKMETENAIMEAVAVVWNLIRDIEDINVILDSCAKIAQTAFCAAEPGGTNTVTMDDMHGVLFMLSNTLFEKHAELAVLTDAAHRIVTTNKTLQEANQRRLTQKYD